VIGFILGLWASTMYQSAAGAAGFLWSL
jgi:hypothetical protein